MMTVDNISKLLQYLAVVSKDTVKVVNKKGIEETYGDKIESICLNKTFFYSDSCFMCGGCCPSESNVYTESEYKAIKDATHKTYEVWGLDYSYNEKLKEGLHVQTVTINNKDIHVYQYNKDENIMYLPVRGREINRCSWCFEDNQHHYKCRIHPVRSITCIMPHLRFFHKSKSHSTSMGISQFGRNWQLGCKVAFKEPESEKEFDDIKLSRISKLERLNQVGLDMNIETYLPEVINKIDDLKFDNYKNFINQNLIDSYHHLF